MIVRPFMFRIPNLAHIVPANSQHDMDIFAFMLRIPILAHIAAGLCACTAANTAVASGANIDLP